MNVSKKVWVHPKDSRTSFNQILDVLRQDPGYVDVGATAGFTGIVRGKARDNRPLQNVIISAEQDTQMTLERISKETETEHDIVQQCAIHIHTGELKISEPLMFVMIAGTQGPERVPELFDIIVSTVERIKREAKIKLLEKPAQGDTYVTRPDDPTKSFD
ncbi:MAG: molybdenum cofactor biosynthesis protein MoaE [Candidatus Ranarchaeia archaeon]